MKSLITLLLRQIKFCLGEIPRQGRSRYEIYQVRIFNHILFYAPLLSLAANLSVGFQSNAAERIGGSALMLLVFWGLIQCNKMGYDHISRPIFVVFTSLFTGYISYREGHQINTQLILFLIPMIGFAITPRNRPLGIGLSILFPSLVLVATLFMAQLPFITPVERSAQEIHFLSNIATLVYFILLIYAAWLIVNMNNRLHNNLVERIEISRRQQRELIKRQQELLIAQRLAKVGFWEFTSEGYSRWNDETYEILNAPKGAAVNRELIESCVHPEDADFVIENLEKGVKEGGKYSFNFRLHPKSGERWIAVSCIQAKYIPEKKFFHSKGIVQDITTAKQTEQQLLQTLAAKDRVLATVSHDLRNPVTTTLQLLDLVAAELQKSNYGEGKKLLLEYQEMMRISQQRTMNIIEDLLELCTQKNVVHLSGQRTDLFSLVEQTVYPQIYRAAKKGLLLQLKPAKNDIIINAVPDKIARALENLIVNAIKFTPMGGKITVAVEKSEGFALIAVADTGIGIPEHLKKHLFEQFGQTRRYGTEGESSTGLGLSIVKQWVEMHNGTVWCEDNKPHGTVFYMSFPLAEDESNTLPSGGDTGQLVNTF